MVFSVFKSIKIRRAKNKDCKKIVELFIRNYPDGYYDKNFSCCKKMESLIMNEKFIGIVALDLNRETIIGFSGLYLQENKDVMKIYLSNFLVDQEYRGKGIGNMIEEEKNIFFLQQNKKIIVYSLVIPRTLGSLKSKIGHGYKIWGIRNFFGEQEPSPVGHGHLFVVGKLVNFNEIIVVAPILKKVTKNLLNSLGYPLIYLSDCAKKEDYSFEIIFPDDIKYGQCCVDIVHKKETNKTTMDIKTIIEVIERLKKLTKIHAYVAIRINTNFLSAFAGGVIENILLKNQFFGTSFLPYFDDGQHMIEYQYIDESKIEDISTSLSNHLDIKKYFN